MSGEVSVNQLCVSGHLEDVVLRHTQKGDPVCNCTIVLVDGQSNGRPKTQYLKATAWRGLATRLAELPPKAKVRVTGKLQTASWEDKESKQRKYRMQVEIDWLEEVPHLQSPARNRTPVGHSTIAIYRSNE